MVDEPHNAAARAPSRVALSMVAWAFMKSAPSMIRKTRMKKRGATMANSTNPWPASSDRRAPRCDIRWRPRLSNQSSKLFSPRKATQWAAVGNGKQVANPLRLVLQHTCHKIVDGGNTIACQTCHRVCRPDPVAHMSRLHAEVVHSRGAPAVTTDV